LYWKYFLVFLTLVLHSISAGCSGREVTERIEIVQEYETDDPGEVTLGGKISLFSIRPDTLNPIRSFNAYVKYYAPILYDGLYRLDPEQMPQNWLSEREEVSENGLVWTFKIREGVRWHNGFNVTTDDVEYTFKSILDPANENIYRNNLQNVLSFSVVNSLTFQVTLEEKDVFFPSKLTFPILSAGYYLLDGSEEKDTRIPPVGTGPFMFSYFEGEMKMVLARNENWWGNHLDQNPLQRPYLDEVNIIFYKDSSQMAGAFQNGDIDLAIFEQDDFSRFRKRTDIAFKTYASNEFEFLAFNLNSDSPVSQQEVRRSIAEAVDRNLMINSVLGGAGIPSNYPITPESYYFKSFLWSFTPSIDKAHTILFDENWRLENGFYTKTKDGISRRLEFTLLINAGNSRRMGVAQNLKDQLRDIGMDVKILVLENQQYYEALMNGDYEVALMGITLPFYPEFKSLYSSRERVINVSGYNEVVMDNLLAIFYSLRDARSQIDMLEKMMIQITKEVPYLGLYFHENALVYQRSLRGDFKPRSWNQIHDITTWFFKLETEREE
jgi:peptide/nickel transport system substrate-binding protein